MRLPCAGLLSLVCVACLAATTLALDEFDRHTSKYLREAAEKNAAVATLSSGQASKLKTLGSRIEHACIVVHTNDGNWAKALVSWGFRKGKDGAGKEGAKEALVPIVVLERYVTYDRDRGDVTIAHGRNVMLFPGYEFDFDIGQVVPAGSGADLKFTPDRQLAAIDKAKLHPVNGSVLPATPPDKYDPQDHADVRPRDFAGTWRVNADGRWVGTWEIAVDTDGDVTGRYTSEETKGTFAIRGHITETEVRHRLRFEVEFAAASQQYDMYLWTTDKSKMAGTTTLISRTFGVVAERLPAAGAPKAKAEPAKQSARERLRKPVTLANVSAELPMMAKLLEEQCGVSVRVRAADLKAEGIAPDQRLTMDVQGKPGDVVLRELLSKAGAGNRLVYVFRREQAEEWIEITSRSKAQERGERIPPELRTPLADRLKQPVAFHTEGKQPIAAVLEQFSRDSQTGLLVRWNDLPEEGDQARRVELDAEKMPAGEVVRTLLKSAYGETAIYVLANVAGEEFVVVTTREAAQKRGDQIPAEFSPAKP